MKALLWVACLACAAPAFGQQATTYTYDEAVIRPNTTGSGSSRLSIHPGSYAGTNVSLKAMLLNAFGLQTTDQLVGLPGWAGDAHYDVTAKVDGDTIAHSKSPGVTLDHAQAESAGQQAAQQLLAGRFGLKAHHETRELAEYALVQAKSGSKLVAGDELAPKAGGVHTSNRTLNATAVRLEELTAFLAQQVHRPVVDRTGLEGKFDLVLVWTPDDAVDAAAASSTATATEKAPGLFTALQEQMGLKLESDTRAGGCIGGG